MAIYEIKIISENTYNNVYKCLTFKDYYDRMKHV